MKSELKLSLATLLAVVLCAGMATAETTEGGDKPKGDGPKHTEGEAGPKGEKKEGEKAKRPDPLFKEITLTDEQKAKVKEVREAGKEELAAIRAEMKEAKDSKDEAAMKAATEKYQAFNEKLYVSIRELLAEDQHEQFDKNVKAIKERGMRGGGEGERPRRGGGDGEGERPRRGGGDGEGKSSNEGGDGMNL